MKLYILLFSLFALLTGALPTSDDDGVVFNGQAPSAIRSLIPTYQPSATHSRAGNLPIPGSPIPVPVRDTQDSVEVLKALKAGEANAYCDKCSKFHQKCAEDCPAHLHLGNKCPHYCACLTRDHEDCAKNCGWRC